MTTAEHLIIEDGIKIAWLFGQKYLSARPITGASFVVESLLLAAPPTVTIVMFQIFIVELLTDVGAGMM